MGGALDGKVALVTGGTGGIGTAICKRLSNMGARVVSSYLGENKARDMQTEMKAQGCDVAIYRCDVSDFEQCQALAASIDNDLGPVDILVNNAGIIRRAPALEFSEADWDAVIQINLQALCFLSQATARLMVEAGGGRII